MMPEELSQTQQQSNTVFFEQLVASGFFPQSPELVLNLTSVNPGNEQKLQTPDTTKSEQQTGIATEDLEKQVIDTSNQQKSIIDLKPPEVIDTSNQQKSIIDLKPPELINNEQNTQQLPIQQDQTRSLSTAENNIQDLDQKSKLKTANPSTTVSEEQLQVQEEQQPSAVMTNERSTTNVKMIDPDYTQILMEKYKSLPNWRSVMG